MGLRLHCRVFTYLIALVNFIFFIFADRAQCFETKPKLKTNIEEYFHQVHDVMQPISYPVGPRDKRSFGPDSSLTFHNISLHGQRHQQRLIVVDKLGNGDFKSVQAAIDSVPIWNTQRVVIRIHSGVYWEKVTVPYDKPFITFRGSKGGKTVISWGDTAASAGGTWSSASVGVDGDFFIAEQMTFMNTAPSPPPGAVDRQAVALRVTGNKAAFYNCRILGSQDTLFDASGLHLFRNCFIQGSIDFIFGNGQSLYLDCILSSIAKTYGSIAAHNRQQPGESTGFSFVNCNVTGSGQVYLGRAMGPYSRIVFSNTYMDDLIFPPGWEDWHDPARQKSVFYAQYKCLGPGADVHYRVPWSHILSYAQAKQFISLDFIDGTNWLNV